MRNSENDDLENLPHLSLSDDERISRIEVPENKKNIKSKRKKINIKSVLMPCVIFLLIVFLFWQMNVLQEKNNKNEAKIAQMITQIDQVSGIMESNGMSATKSTGQLKEQIKSLIVSQKNLEKNAGDITKKVVNLQAEAKDNQKDIGNLRWRNKLDAKAQSSQEKRIADLSARVDNVDKGLERVSTSQLSVTADLDERLESIKKEAVKTIQALSKTSDRSLGQKISNYESALKSMDNYRLQINRRLLQVENSIREIQKHIENKK